MKRRMRTENGIIFENNAIPLYSEDTVFDILLNTAKTYDLQLILTSPHQSELFILKVSIIFMNSPAVLCRDGCFV